MAFYNNKSRFLLLVALFLVLGQLLTTPAKAADGILKQINFQGKVVNANGTNVTDGDYDFSFSLYTAASGGSPIWTEDHDGGNQVTVADGIFRVSLGSITSLPGSVNFNTDSIYLGITFNNDGAGEMSPRVRFTGVPYAFNADQVNGLGVTYSSGDLSLAPKSGDGAMTVTTTGNAKALTLNTGAATAGNSGNLVIQSGDTSTSGTSGSISIDSGAGASSNGSIGIGTTNTRAITIGNSTSNTGLTFTSGTGGISATSTKTSGTVLSVTDSANLSGSLIGQSIALSGTGAQDQTGLLITLSGASGSNLNALVVNNGTVDTAILSKTGALTLGNPSDVSGSLTLASSAAAGTTTFQVGNQGGTSLTYTLPTAAAGANTGYYLTADTSGVMQWSLVSSGCSACIQQVPAATADNTVTPTADSVVGLTVNATSGVAANAAIINQSQGGVDAVDINVTNSSGTVGNALQINKSGGGTLTNGLSIAQSAGTLTDAINISGTISGNILSTPSIDIDANGSLTGVGTNITAAAGLTIATTGANNLALNSGSNTITSTATTLTTSTLATFTTAATLGMGSTTTLNLGASATINAASGTLTIGNANSTTVNIGRAAQTGSINLRTGVTTGTAVAVTTGSVTTGRGQSITSTFASGSGQSANGLGIIITDSTLGGTSGGFTGISVTNSAGVGTGTGSKRLLDLQVGSTASTFGSAGDVIFSSVNRDPSTSFNLLRFQTGSSLADVFKIDGYGGLTQTYSSSTDATATQILNFTNASTSGSVTVSGVSITPNGTATSGTNTINGLLLGAPGTPNSNTFYALNIGSGYNDVLRVNGTQIIDGSGVIQSAGVSGSYTNITGVGTLAAGTWNGTAIGSQYGGTGQNFASSTGVPTLSSGTWSVASTLATNRGGTNLDTSAQTGVTTINSGTWSVSNQLPISMGGTNTGSYSNNYGVVYYDGSALETTTTGSNGECLKSTGAGSAPAYSSCSTVTTTWSSIAAPTSSLSLNMYQLVGESAKTTTFTWGNATGANNLFTIEDSATNSSATGYLFNVASSTGSTIYPFRASAAGTEAILVNPDGNVGIGTTSPSTKLHILGNSRITGLVSCDSIDTDVNGNLACGTDAGAGASPFGSSGGIITKSTAADRLSLRYGDAGDIQLEIENTTAATIPTADAVKIDLTGNTTGIITNGVSALNVLAEFGNGTANTNYGINIGITPVNSPSGDEFFYGLNIADITTTSAYEAALNTGTGWDYAAIFEAGNVGIGTTQPSAALQITTGAVSGGAAAFSVNPGAYTGQTAERIDFNVAGHTDTITGGYSTQRFNLLGQSTLNAATSQTVTNASTLSISGAPAISGSAAITNSYGLKIDAGAVGAVTRSYGLFVDAQTGGTNNYAASFASGNVGIGTTTPTAALQISTGAVSGGSSAVSINPGDYTDLTAERIDFNIAGHTNTITGAYATQRFNLIGQSTITAASGLNVTNASTLEVAGAPARSGSATITNTYAIKVAAGAVSTATNSYGLYVDAQTGATNNYAASFATGNVGIGTTAPSSMLQVGSNVNRGDVKVNGDVIRGGYADQTTLSNIVDTFIYDTTRDVDGGAWTDSVTSRGLSWYTESKDDGPGDACVVGTDDRCGQSSFPKKAIIVATTTAVHIFDANTNTLWMSFTQNASGYALGVDTNNNPSSVFALNGVLYVGANGSSAGGLYAFDFVGDRLYNYNTTDRDQGNKDVANRNTAVTYATDSRVPMALNSNAVNDVHATVIYGGANILTNGGPLNGATFIATASDDGMSVINLSGGYTLDYGNGAITDNYQAVFVTKRGRLFGLNSTDSSVDRFGLITTSANSIDTAVANVTTVAKAFNATAGPARLAKTAPTFATGAPDALEVIERASMAEIDTTAGIGDLLYVGHSQGLTEIHDTNAVSSATIQPWSKFYTTSFETGYMAATIKGMFPFNETTGDLVDASPIANVLEPENPPTYGVNGVHGTGLDFDGSADYLCSDSDNNGACDVDADFAVGTTAFHVQLWFKSPTTAAARTLVDKTVTAAGAASSGWRIWMTNTGTISFGIDGDATTFPSDVATSTRDYDDDQWHHLVAVKLNTSSGVLLYIDGQLVGSDTAGVVATTLDATTTMLAVGARCNAIAACTTATEFFDGSIDDLQMSMGGATTTDTLNQSQVRRMYLEGRAAMSKKTTIVDNPTAFSSTTIGDSGEAYILNEFVGSIVEITAGTGAGQTRRVIGNNSTTLTVSPAWSTTPDATSDYEVNPEVLYGSSDVVKAVGATDNEFLGRSRRLYVGTNSGSDGGGVTVFEGAGNAYATDVYHGDSEKADSSNSEWTGSSYDNVIAIDAKSGVVSMVNGAAYWVESQDRYTEQSLDYLANNIYSIRGEILHDAAGANSPEIGQGGGADLAEHYYSNDELVPGQVVQLDTTQKSWVKLSNKPYQANVLGVVSTAPGITLGEQTGQGYPIGLVGRVPVKVTDENGPIRVGDYLTSSSTPGYAMRATYAGPVIGQALEDYSESSIEECPEVTNLMEPLKQCGQVLMFIKTTYYNGISSEGIVSETEASGSAGLSILGNIRERLKQVGGVWDASEMLIGKLKALEILGGEISADLLRLETLQTYTGKDLNIELNEGGEMVVLNEAKESVFSIDALGNAIFKGTVQADKIKANQIEGLQILAEELVTSQLRQATASGNLNASNSAQLSVVVNEATAAANEPPILASSLEDLAILGSVTINKSAKIGLDLAVLGDLTANGSLIVSGPTTFNGESFFQSIANFFKRVIFKDQVEFAATPIFNQDTGGVAIIEPSQQFIEIRFSKPYDYTPIVTANIVSDNPENNTPEDLLATEVSERAILDQQIKYLITRRSKTGFIIRLDQPASRQLRFNWSAIMVKDPNITINQEASISARLN